MAGGFNPNEYVDVAERITAFYARYPEGRLQTGDYDIMEVGGKWYVAVEAFAYRVPDDPLPGKGLAWEPVPGSTSFTRESELMNAETSAWGRAIVALGFETKHLASREEVRNRQDPPSEASLNTVQKPVGSQEPDPWMKEANRLARAAGIKIMDIPEILDTGAVPAVSALRLWAHGKEYEADAALAAFQGLLEEQKKVKNG